MRNIFIIHGSYGYPSENWFPWLKRELEKLGHKVFVPQFQIPKNIDLAYGSHDLDKWLRKLNNFRRYINQNTIFITHSRGGVFTYHFLSLLKNPVAAVFMVAPWIVYRWYPKGWNKTDSFHKIPFNWEKIKKGSKYFEIYQSTNDDIPVMEGKEIAKKLKAKFILVKNAGHFNKRFSLKFIKFPLLLRNIKKIL